MPRVRRYLVLLTALSIAALLPIPSSSRVAEADAPRLAQPNTALNSLWSAYGDQGGHWTGGDSTASVPLPDGRTAWLFSDTFLGTVNPNGTRPASAPMVHNSLVVQQNGELVRTLVGGTATAPRSLVEVSGSDLQYWVADGTVEGSALRVIYNQYDVTGTGSLDVELRGTALATFSLPGLTLTGLQTLPLGSTIAWGNAILEDGAYTYLYGSEHTTDGMVFLHVARVPAGGLGSTWQFWTGSAWSAAEADSARLVSGVGTAFSVTRVGGRYVLVTQDSNLLFSPLFVAYTAPAPTGPFGSPTVLFQAAEWGDPDRPIIVYDGRVHQQYNAADTLVMSYNVNSLDPRDNLDDVTIYRPRFMNVPWPPAPPEPGIPPAPTGLTVRSDDDGVAYLDWTAPPGTGLTYHLYQRDVTAGQTYPSRVPTSYSEPTAQAALLKDGHTYEFRVSASNGTGEGQQSAPVTMTALVTPPAAPGNLRATPDGDGQIRLAWDAVPGSGVTYTVYQRDTTAGEPEFLRLSIVDPTRPGTTIGYLQHNHAYEFKVTARNGGGESPFSAVVTAIAHWALPPTPTGLVAAPKPDGDITLSWAAPASNLWYWVYQRDVTAGETEFTKLIYPILDTTFTAGYLQQDHVYEFKVASTNQGGDSAPTAPVTVTAHATTPPVPTGLTATPLPDGTIRLSWTAPAAGLWYWIYQRDVTAGQAEFTRLIYPITEGTTFAAGYLIHDHEYEFQVASTTKGGDSAPSAPARATAHYQLPPVPTGLTAAAQADGSIALSWTAPGANLWYWVYLRDVTAGETEFTKLIYPVTTGTWHTASGLTHAHLYEFKVSAINAAGEGPASAPASAVPDYPLPGAPTNLTATPGDGQVGLSWTAPPGEVWYWVYYRDVSAGQADFIRAAYPIAGQTTVTLGSLINGNTYEFKVTAINQAGEGEPSNVVQARPLPPRPGRPTGLTATPGTDGSVTLSWTAPGPSLYYWVYLRDVSAGQAFQRLAYPVTTGTSHVLTGLTNNHVYEFKVAGTNLAGDGPDSDVVSATVHYDRPPAPANLRGTSSGDGTVALDWDAPGPNLYYWIYLRDVTAGQATFTRSAYPTAETQGSWGLLADGHTYEFRVTAENAGGEGPASNTVRVVARATLPAAPTNLRVTPGDGQVRLDWTASSTPGVWYWIFHRDATIGQSWQRSPYPLDPANGGTTFTATYLTNGHTYQFKVTATNSAGDSPPSNVVSATPVQPRPTPPTNLAATPQPNQVLLTWTASATPGVWYWVEYRDVSIGQGWQRLPLPLGGGTSFTFTGLSGHDYQFRLRSTNAGGDSDPSNVAAARPLPPLPPSGLTATAGVAQVALRWNASPTPNVWYWVEYRDATIGQAWQRAKYPIAGGTSYTMTGLRGHVYEFRVRSTAMSGESAPSNVVSAVPLPPLPPSNLTATPQPTKILLRWTASPTPNVWYWVEYRSAFGGPWTRLPLPIGGATSFTMTGLPEMPYQFRIRSVGISGDSVPSNVVTATPLPPMPPSNLTAVAGDMQATLNWSPSPTPGVWYWPEYRNASRNGTWVQAAYPIPGTSWTPGFLSNGDVYEFRVRATTAYSMSGYSNIAAARPFPPVPAAPGWLSAWTSSAYYSVELSWGASPTPRVTYWVYYRLAGDHIWTRTTYPVWGTSVTMCCMVGGEVSEFAVAATNMAGDGPWSNVADAWSRPRMGGFGWRFGNQINGSNRWARRLTAGPCESGDHQMICYNSASAAFNRPMTVGDYLLYPNSEAHLDSRLLCESYKRANIRWQYGRSTANDRGPLLLAHEARHSTQWSWHLDYRTFLAAYAVNSRWFEDGANLWWGGYNIQPSGSRFGRGPGNCGWLYP